MCKHQEISTTNHASTKYVTVTQLLNESERSISSCPVTKMDNIQPQEAQKSFVNVTKFK